MKPLSSTHSGGKGVQEEEGEGRAARPIVIPNKINAALGLVSHNVTFTIRGNIYMFHTAHRQGRFNVILLCYEKIDESLVSFRDIPFCTVHVTYVPQFSRRPRARA